MKAIAKTVVKATAEVVATVDPKAGKQIASQANAIGNQAQLFTARVGKGLESAAVKTGETLRDSVSKDGALTNFVQDYVPAGGFVTAIFHAAAGNEEYAQYAAVKGLSTTVVTGAAVVGSLGGPAGAVLAGGLAGAAVSAWEGGMKTVLDPSVQGKLQDLSVENVLISGAMGAAAAGFAVGAGKALGAASRSSFGQRISSRFFKTATTEVTAMEATTITKVAKPSLFSRIMPSRFSPARPRSTAIVEFTRPRSNTIVQSAPNKLIPLWRVMTTADKATAVGTLTLKEIAKGTVIGGAKVARDETLEATGLTAENLKTQAADAEEADDNKLKVLAGLAGAGAIIAGMFVFTDVFTGSDSSTGAGVTTSVAVATSRVGTVATATTANITSVAPTTASTGVATTVAATVPATTPPATTKTTTKATTPVTPASTTTAVPTAPNAPTGVSGSDACNGANVNFTAPANNGGSPIDYYTVTSSSGATATGSSTTIFVSDADGTWSYTVRATNAAGFTGPGASSSSVLLDAGGCG